MNNNWLLQEIDDAIKDVWITEIKKDYEAGWLLREDSLKNSFYYHLRNRLDFLLKNHNMRIYTEYKISGYPYRADLVIAELNDTYQTERVLADSVKKVKIVVEFKFKGYSTEAERSIQADIDKIRSYIDKNIADYYYLAVIYEASDDTVFFMKPQEHGWASGKVTELAAGYVNDKLIFDYSEL